MDHPRRSIRLVRDVVRIINDERHGSWSISMFPLKFSKPHKPRQTLGIGRFSTITLGCPIDRWRSEKQLRALMPNTKALSESLRNLSAIQPNTQSRRTLKAM